MDEILHKISSMSQAENEKQLDDITPSILKSVGKYTAAASGLFMTMVCGGGILPAIQGWIADMAGFMNSYFLILAGVAYIFFYALAGHKNVNKDIPVE